MTNHVRARLFFTAGLLGSALLLANGVPDRSLAATDQVMLINMQTSKCLTIAGGMSTDNNVEALQFTCDSHPSRRWRLVRMGSAFQIKNLQTGKCLTIAGGVSTENNVTALQFNCDSHPSRRWRINRVGSGFQIQNVQTGKCLTIAGGVSTANNVTALQFTCDSHPSRKWQVKASVIID
ncbi:RICIN domain-containing protein [Taklimakanibacter lacteus]|uniref:RICIN domain-containing protein n=1 Tax=Taklimakanibacter lacteus TaxID=2268456 RepID=UPI000E66C080